ncbi:Pyruvate/Phosphoenolpyruvate kinase [Penicillium italicum]|uniref:Pyruvate/Phosphoenolpyruvate kinase n=1 Tax=Penicillium italicum TaxID=40296 RepID=A0A0A2L6T6_PENIT|nr:Pyruvate/Phosphoenolpyruvate kinase [Penicillium italicum]
MRKERVVTIPESYVRRLESEIAQLRQPSRDNQRAVTHASDQLTTPLSNGSQEQGVLPERLIENSTTEYFVRKLKGVYSTPTQEKSGVSPFPTTSTPDVSEFHNNEIQSTTSNYTYIPLEYDNSQPKVLVKLPPHSYALYLLGQFESFMGCDYHWYQKKRFRARINGIYDPSQSQAIERTWLCCFSVVLALGDSYNDNIAPSFLIDNRTGFSTNAAATTDSEQATPRGIEFFKQGLLLLRPSYEEPTIEQVEALNLITFYCYSLNRRKTAYAYAGMALRLAMLLGLSKPQRQMSPLEQEHCKRIWWTTICMDVMTCTELSLTPTHAFDEDSIDFPDNSQLSADDAEEFSDPQYLTAQVKLCRIKYQIIKQVFELRLGNAVEAQALIEPCLQALNNWRLEFSPTLVFAEEGGFSDETLAFLPMRTIASLLLRYNQSSNIFTAKFGFWESLHIFSSLTVHVISGFLMEKQPAAFAGARTNAPYSPVRSLLGEMARVGNAASKDHERMIQDIEDLFTETPSNTDLTEGIEDLICTAALLIDITPFVRVPYQCGNGFVQRVLDGGAMGVVFPHIHNKGDAEAAVGILKYSPQGFRSMTGQLPVFGLRSTSVKTIIEETNAHASTVLLMIETNDSIENVDDIAAVDGVDVLLIGSNDLAIELGVPGQFESTEFRDALEKVSQSCQKHRKISGLAGIYNVPEIQDWALNTLGARFILAQQDSGLIAGAGKKCADVLYRIYKQ